MGGGEVWGWQALKKFEESELADAGEAFTRNKRTTLKPMEREHCKEQLERIGKNYIGGEKNPTAKDPRKNPMKNRS